MQGIEHASRLLRLLAKKKLLATSPLNIIEIGLGCEPASFWGQYGPFARIHRFERDASLIATLNAKSKRFPMFFCCHPMERMAVQPLKTIDTCFPGAQLDFLHTDIRSDRGMSLEKLSRLFEERHILGAQLDFEFSPPPGSASLSELETFLRAYGYRLYDMDLIRSSSEALHYPVAGDHRDATGDLIFGPTTRGPLAYGRALFFKNLDSEMFQSEYWSHRQALSLLKLASLFTLYGLADCAATILLEHRELVDAVFSTEDLLDLLVPDYFGAGLTYREYKQAYLTHVGRPKAKSRKRLLLWNRTTT